jgi:hypothetical protein
MASPNTSLAAGNVVFEATGDAFADTIGEIFTIPEANIEGQLVEMTSGDTSYQTQASEETVSTNANANDDGLDAALIDLLPF